MPHRTAIRRSLLSACGLVVLLAASSGCQSLRSSTIPGMSLEKSDRQLLRHAEKDPFPSPSDVGMSAAK